jgi:hypothetical protein
MPQDCAFNFNTGCITCPHMAPVIGVPGRYVVSPNNGWTAGANSVAEIDGDLHAVFDIGRFAIGSVTGLKATRANQTAPAEILFGWYVHANGTGLLAEALERAVRVYGPVAYALSTPLEIRRVSGAVTYFINGVPVFRSAQSSSGPLVLNACLYAGGDELG